MEIYITSEGDSYAAIADSVGVDEGYLRSVNGAASGEPALGQAVVIIRPERTVTVGDGETLYGIASANGMTLPAIYRLNPALGGRTEIYPGQVIVLSVQGERRGQLETNGYTYTNVDEALLRSVLPYMSYLTIFTYGFTPEGELLEPQNEERLLGLCREYGTAPIMMISTLTSEGSFSNQLSNALFTSPEATGTLISRLIARAEELGYYGIDVDFEYVFATDTDAFAAFVSALTEAANARGIRVWIALAPKSYAEQPGLLYEAHNYSELGAAANYSTLMTYEWGYRYGPPWLLRRSIRCAWWSNTRSPRCRRRKFLWVCRATATTGVCRMCAGSLPRRASAVRRLALSHGRSAPQYGMTGCRRHRISDTKRRI